MLFVSTQHATAFYFKDLLVTPDANSFCPNVFETELKTMIKQTGHTKNV